MYRFRHTLATCFDVLCFKIPVLSSDIKFLLSLSLYDVLTECGFQWRNLNVYFFKDAGYTINNKTYKKNTRDIAILSSMFTVSDLLQNW